MVPKVVVIGSGGREHALVRALLRGARWGGPREVVCIPGNPGIAQQVRCVPGVAGAAALAAAAIAERPGLVVVGPEAPLADGLADRLAEAGVPCFGPSAAAAHIESSKAFAKEVMAAAGVPTGASAAFHDRERARAHARAAGACVVKLDGLFAGKGVIVCDDAAQAEAAVDELWAAGGGPVLVEERLSGPELSVIGLCDGERVLALPGARDHKRIFDGDRGPNTGGMGVLCSPRDSTAALLEETVRTVLEPTARELARRGAPFRGALYAGLMLTPAGPRVLEFNCRFGDPEAQAILLRLQADPLPLLAACAAGRLEAEGFLGARRPAFDPRTAVAVVLAAAGYPAAPRAGDAIEGLEALAADQPGGQGDDLWVLHAGTRAREGRFETSGGRVLTVAALGAGARAARARAYEAAGRIHWDGVQLRRDIGAADEA